MTLATQREQATRIDKFVVTEPDGIEVMGVEDRGALTAAFAISACAGSHLSAEPSPSRSRRSLVLPTATLAVGTARAAVGAAERVGLHPTLPPSPGTPQPAGRSSPPSYLDRRRVEATHEHDSATMTFRSWANPIEAYFEAMKAAGLLVEVLREPAVRDEAVAGDPRERRWQRLPEFLFLRALKPEWEARELTRFAGEVRPVPELHGRLYDLPRLRSS